MAAPRCRSLLRDARLLGAPEPDAERVSPEAWRGVVDGVYCIVAASNRNRWPSLAAALRGAGLLDATRLVYNEARCACDDASQVSDPVLALRCSHLAALEAARAAGHRRALVLEDDVYFDLDALPASLAALTAFYAGPGAEALPLLHLGGVYLSAAAAAPRVLRGRAVQLHAYVALPFHAAWRDIEASPKVAMDLATSTVTEAFLLHPAVAFQRPFVGQAASWPLHELAPFERSATRAMLGLGIGNCWERCSRAVNAATAFMGSIHAAVGLALALVVVALCVATRLKSL